MIEIIWEFRVSPENKTEFERHYGPEGTWAKLFRSSDEYVGTQLLRDTEIAGRYLTVDRWQKSESFAQFKAKFAKQYERLDAEMESLTESENRLGMFQG